MHDGSVSQNLALCQLQERVGVDFAHRKEGLDVPPEVKETTGRQTDQRGERRSSFSPGTCESLTRILVDGKIAISPSLHRDPPRPIGNSVIGMPRQAHDMVARGRHILVDPVIQSNGSTRGPGYLLEDLGRIGDEVDLRGGLEQIFREVETKDGSFATRANCQHCPMVFSRDHSFKVCPARGVEIASPNMPWEGGEGGGVSRVKGVDVVLCASEVEPVEVHHLLACVRERHLDGLSGGSLRLRFEVGLWGDDLTAPYPCGGSILR